MKSDKTTLIIGASNNPERYSYRAAYALHSRSIPFILFGVKKGEVLGQSIYNNWDENWQIDTVTLYINPKLQEAYYDQIISLRPRRVIFNPGTENNVFRQLLENQEIKTENACTLVLLSMGVY
jgi:uncharacterized protein